VLRRMSAAGRADLGGGRVRIGRCVLDLAAHRLMDDEGGEVPISPLEFDLLKALAEHPNQALSRERILNLNGQRDWDPFDRSVDLRIMRLRRKIEPDPGQPRFIRTLRNEGYVFVPDGQ
jgi:two-component system phosphate regulon response regulator OmpR